MERMEGFRIDVSENIAQEDLISIENGLKNFTDQITNISDRKPLSVVIRETNSGKVLGGILGRSSLGLLFIDFVYLPPELRSMGIGKGLLQRFEDEGRKRGCVAGFLYTMNIHAPGFYKKSGWEEFGKIDCLPDGACRIFMKKKLQACWDEDFFMVPYHTDN